MKLNSPCGVSICFWPNYQFGLLPKRSFLKIKIVLIFDLPYLSISKGEKSIGNLEKFESEPNLVAIELFINKIICQ